MEEKSRKIFTLLENIVSPGIAEYYLDACNLLDNPNQLHSVSHIIGYIFREIESAVRDVAIKIDDDVRELIESIEKTDFNKKHALEVRILLLWLGFNQKTKTAITWKQLSIEGKWSFSKLTHRDMLQPPRHLTQDIINHYDDFQEALLDVLSELEKRFGAVFDTIDRIVKKTDLPKNDIKYLKQHFPRTQATIKYLFENINSPQWINILNRLDFFKDPPGLIPDADRNMYWPHWPAAEFLNRVVSNYQETSDLIISIIRKVPATGNLFVSQELLEALAKMSPELAVRASEAVYTWLKAEENVQFSEDWIKYILHICEVCTNNENTKILKELLAVNLDSEDIGAYRLKPIKLADTYFYASAVKEIVDHIKLPCIETFIVNFIELLNDAERIAQSKMQKHDREYNLHY